MQNKQFKNLKVGDKVQLTDWAQEYCFRDQNGSRLWVAPGTVGTVGAVGVPAVRGKERSFACVDFPPSTKLFNVDENETAVANIHQSNYRVAIWGRDADLLD